MSDSNPWQSPDNSSGSDAPSPPSPSISPAAFSGSPVPPGAAGPGWALPPRPGLVPLQPMTLGTILSGSFRVMRRNPRPTFGVSLLINGIIAVISLGAVGLSLSLGFDRLATASSDAIAEITAGSNALSLLSSLITLALSLVGGAILQGIISLEVARATVGEKLTARGLWALARGRVAVLVGWSILVGVVVIIAVGVVTAVVVILIMTQGTAGLVVGILVALAAVGIGVALALWLGTKLSLVPSVLLIERARLLPALRRSWSLTTGYFWRTLGIQLLVNVIVTVASQVILVPVGILLVLMEFLTNPNADPTATDNLFFFTLVISTVVSALIGSITAIITSATSALIYVDLRMRKEGLDLALMKFVEARQVGDNSVPDPYLFTPAQPTPSHPAQFPA